MIDPKGELKRIDENVIQENRIQEYPKPELILSQNNNTIEEYPKSENTPLIIEQEEQQPQNSNIFSAIFFIIVFIFFILFSIYYAYKYTLNEKNYLIKSNAKTYKINLDELKHDIKNWLRTSYYNIEEYFDKLFSNRHIKNGTFVVKKSKAKNLVKEQKTE